MLEHKRNRLSARPSITEFTLVKDADEVFVSCFFAEENS